MERPMITIVAMTYLCLLFIGTALPATNIDCKRLNNYVSCYHNIQIKIWIESHSLLDGMFESKREELIHAFFNAFNKTFHLVLAPEPIGKTILSKDINIKLISKNSGKSVEESSNAIKEVYGRIIDQESTVRGIIVNGSDFSGLIETTDEIYYVEHVPNVQSTVVYRYRDIETGLMKQNTGMLHQSNHSRLRRNAVSADWVLRGDSSNSERPLNRKMRSISLSPTRSICHFHVSIDYRFFRYRAGSSTDNVLSLMISFFDAARFMFRKTDFNRDSLGDNIGFMIDDVDIYTTLEESEDQIDSGNSYVDLLTNFGKRNFDSYCLAVLFTHTDYGGTLGAAYKASSSRQGSSGGLCQLNTYTTTKSGNILFITSLDKGNTLPTVVSASTLAHEIGHSFGSPHDSDTCLPGGQYGNYLMSAIANDGSKPNHFEFSVCSKQYINPVIVNKGSCLERLSDDFGVCGDGIIDPGEQCDCGSITECLLNNQCCNPLGVNGCTFAAGYTCSPRVSGCCNSSCVISPVATICVGETECSLESVCDGVDPECPVPEPQPNGSSCDEETRICYDGVCTLNMCLTVGLSQCQCLGSADTLCRLCCIFNSICVSASSLGLRTPSGAIVYHTPGQPCNNYHGYCNQEMICVMVDLEADIFHLDAFIFSTTANHVLDWFWNYWGLLVILGCLCALLVAVFRAETLDLTAAPLSSLAIQSGKMSLVWQRAAEENKQLKRDAERLESSYRTMMNREKLERPVDYVVAVARMATFFPTAPQRDLLHYVMMSNSEEDAVKQLLLKGFPMLRLLTREIYESIDVATENGNGPTDDGGQDF